MSLGGSTKNTFHPKSFVDQKRGGDDSKGKGEKEEEKSRMVDQNRETVVGRREEEHKTRKKREIGRSILVGNGVIDFPEFLVVFDWNQCRRRRSSSRVCEMQI